MNRTTVAAGPSPALELAAVVLLAWIALAGMPLSRSELSISWDALNHQIYLGWMADGARLDRDVMAAASQSYQYPYLYWPLYKLAVGGFSGAWAGFFLATLQMGNVPAVWLIARHSIPGAGWFESALRVTSVALAFMSGLVLSLIDSTSNDLLAATPLLWAIALSLPPAIHRQPPGKRRLVAAGLLAGLSIAFKLSNGPLAIALLPLWAWSASCWKEGARVVLLGGAVMTAGFVLAYAPWSVELWRAVGNPVYPFLDGAFAVVRAAVGWAPP